MSETPSPDATARNRDAWNTQRFEALLSALGDPATAGVAIRAEPERVLRRLSPYLGEIAGKRICSVQGSHGRVAVALALSGAALTVVDFSEENQRFALAMASAAGVTLDYVVCDVMDAGCHLAAASFDVLVLELGILHYHQDLDAFFQVMRKLAALGGRLLLNEFHPVQRKLIWPDGPRDYFASHLIEADVPNPNAAGPSLGKCLYRFWTMGEIVTAAIGAGFIIERLDEQADGVDPSIPGLFTLVCRAG